jgi:accessory gene regulator protein AgrB
VEEILFPKRVICTTAACELAAVAARAMALGSHLAPERGIIVCFVFIFLLFVFISYRQRLSVAGRMILPQAGAVAGWGGS